MIFHRRRSFYPVAIVLLTVAIGGLMYATLNRPASAPSASAPAVTDDEYRTNARAVVVPFLANYAAADTDIKKLVAAEDALSGIMPLVVPVAYKDLHLGLAVSLTLMRDGLRGEAGSEEKGYAKFLKLVGDYPWLAN